MVSKEVKPKDIVLTYSEALEATKFGFFNYFLIFISGLVLAAALFEISTIGYILPIAQCDLNLSNENKGVIMASGHVGIIVSSHLWGFLADTKGRRAVMFPTLLATFLSSILSSFSSNFWSMLILRFINGFLISGSAATIYAYLGEFHTDKTRSRAMMGSAFIFSIGAMFVPILAYLVINKDWVVPIHWLGIVYKPWRLYFVVCSVPGFVSALSFFMLPESPKFLLSQGKEVECKTILQQIYKWNFGKGHLQLGHILPDDSIRTSIVSADDLKKSNFFLAFFRSMWHQTTPLFKKQYLKTTLIICFVQFCLHGANNGMYMWFPHIMNSMAEFMISNPGEPKQLCHIIYEKEANFIQDDGSMNCVSQLEIQTYAYSLIIEILFAVSFALIGVIVNRVGKRCIIAFISFTCSICGLAGAIIDDPAIAAYLYVFLFVLGVATNVLGALTVELYPTHLRATSICVSLMVGRLGSVLVSNVLGLILGSSCELLFYVIYGCMLGCSILPFFLPKVFKEEKSNTDRSC